MHRGLDTVAQALQHGGLRCAGIALQFDPLVLQSRGRTEARDGQGQQREDERVAFLEALPRRRAMAEWRHVRPMIHVISAASAVEQPAFKAARLTWAFCALTTALPIRISRARPWVPLMRLVQMALGTLG